MARPSQKAERERREAEWRAEAERVRKLGDLFSALPSGPEKAALLAAMTDRIIELYNNVKFEQGDVILEFLPNDYAKQLLDWYFDEDGPTSFTPETATGENENPQPRQVQGEPQSPGGAHRINPEQTRL